MSATLSGRKKPSVAPTILLLLVFVSGTTTSLAEPARTTLDLRLPVPGSDTIDSGRSTMGRSGSTGVPGESRNQFPLNAGIHRLKLANGLGVRGWRVHEGLYLGQAKVADRWGLGFLLQSGSSVNDPGVNYFGLNYRGLQYVREF